MAERIATLFIDRHARAAGWRVPEHYAADWTVDLGYEGDPMFRPAGTTPGHALEWSRLLVQLWELGGRTKPWLLEAAQGLFHKTTAIGWDARTGGFYYTLGWDDRPARSDRYWWPCAEGIGAAAVLATVCPEDPSYELWYRRIWGFVDAHMIDHRHGGWFAEIDDNLNRVSTVFVGKPDIYHALQACLIPLLPANGSITRGLSGSGATGLLS
jgi:mannose/cellobiose epimerase-like protein (N-acyl-D-glucosamine 2-epimerase family)